MKKLAPQQLVPIPAASVTNPPTGFMTLFNDSGTIKVKSSTGTVTPLMGVIIDAFTLDGGAASTSYLSIPKIDLGGAS